MDNQYKRKLVNMTGAHRKGANSIIVKASKNLSERQAT
jgi:hypothetical protein